MSLKIEKIEEYANFILHNLKKGRVPDAVIQKTFLDNINDLSEYELRSMVATLDLYSFTYEMYEHPKNIPNIKNKMYTESIICIYSTITSIVSDNSYEEIKKEFHEIVIRELFSGITQDLNDFIQDEPREEVYIADLHRKAPTDKRIQEMLDILRVIDENIKNLEDTLDNIDYNNIANIDEVDPEFNPDNNAEGW